MTDPDPYHAMPGRDRDHLFAAAWYAEDEGELPAGSDVGDTVGVLTANAPARATTGDALWSLQEAGLIERVDGEPNGRARGVRVTAEGYRVLRRGVARLDAVASVGGEA